MLVRQYSYRQNGADSLPACLTERRVAIVIVPSALNVVIIGLAMVIFTFLWRMLAAKWSENPVGQAMAVAL
jgi:hypothetical protein